MSKGIVFLKRTYEQRYCVSQEELLSDGIVFVPRTR